jgi:hypothetical protein
LTSPPPDPPTAPENPIHKWVQTVAVLGAACWAIYTFVWKEILVPSWAPAAMALEVSLTPISQQTTGSVTTQTGRVEMELQVSATNPSSRTLYLLPNYWQLFGIQRQNQAKGQAFAASANEALSSTNGDHAERGSTLQSSPTIATGRLFADDLIQPGEKITRNLIVRVPATYSAATIELLVPALTKPPSPALMKGRTLQWRFFEQEGILPVLCSPQPQEQQGQQCKALALAEIDRQLKAFDPRALVFTKTRQVAL